MVVGPAGSYGVEPAEGEIHRDDQRGIAIHDHEQQTIKSTLDPDKIARREKGK